MDDLHGRRQRMIYLITYSRANIEMFPTRQSFAEAVLQAWDLHGVELIHWVVSLEPHALCDEEDEEMNRWHYHMAIKLSKKSRWLRVRKCLDETFGAKVNFSDRHTTYYSAYTYATKEDSEALHSPNHPELSNPPRTESAIARRKTKARQRQGKQKGKTQRERGLTVYDVSEIIEQKKISKRLELVCFALEQKREGKTSLAEFIANKGANAVEEALAIAKEFSEAEEKMVRAKKTRLDLLRDAKDSVCVDGCTGRWQNAATEVVRNNGIDVSAFCTAIYTALDKGRGKYQNVYVHGPANTGKTFILSPLKTIYKVFCNPATGSFAWMGAEEAEVILL